MCVFPSQLKYCMFLSPILPERGCINICIKVCHVISCSSSNSVCVTEHCSVQIGEREVTTACKMYCCYEQIFV